MSGTQIIKMLSTYGVKLAANDNLHSQIEELVLREGPEIQDCTLADILNTDRLEAEVCKACENLLDALLIDWRHDHNTKETPQRMARMYVREVFKGRYTPMPEITAFPNVKNVDQIYTIGPATIRSACSHHVVPMMGQAWIGVLPENKDGKVLGLSKFVRLADWIFSRPQIQEEAIEMLSDVVWEALQPRGLAIVVRASHMCMTWRGVRETDTSMITSSMRGVFKEDGVARSEFFNLIKGQGY